MASQSRPPWQSSLSSSQDHSPTVSVQQMATSPAISVSLQSPGPSKDHHHTTSVSSSSLQRLKSFSFVKAASKQNGTRTQEEGVAQCPPAKKMLLDENGVRDTPSVAPLCSSTSSFEMEVDGPPTKQSESSSPAPAHTACLKWPSSHPKQQVGARLRPPSAGATQMVAHSSGARGSRPSDSPFVPRQTSLGSSSEGLPQAATARHASSTPVESPMQSSNASSRKQDVFRTPSQAPRRQALSAVTKLRPQIALLDSTASSKQGPEPVLTTPTRGLISQSSLGTPTSGLAQLRIPSSVARLLQTPTNSVQSVRRRFPGPAGLLPALVRWLTDPLAFQAFSSLAALPHFALFLFFSGPRSEHGERFRGPTFDPHSSLHSPETGTETSSLGSRR